MNLNFDTAWSCDLLARELLSTSHSWNCIVCGFLDIRSSNLLACAIPGTRVLTMDFDTVLKLWPAGQNSCRQATLEIVLHVDYLILGVQIIWRGVQIYWRVLYQALWIWIQFWSCDMLCPELLSASHHFWNCFVCELLEFKPLTWPAEVPVPVKEVNT